MEPSESSPAVALIGAGRIGHGMGRNLLSNGFALRVVAHRNRVPIDDLVGRGAVECSSPGEAAARADVVLLCVPSTPAVEAALAGDDGILAHARPGTIVVDASTSDPAATERLAAELDDAGLTLVDAPITRGPNEAAQGRLIVIAGGPQAAIERVQPVFDAYAERVVHSGPVGSAHRLKLAHNILALGHVALLSEALAVAAALEVDLQQLYDVVCAGVAGSDLFRGMVPKLIDGSALEGVVDFSMANALKDVRLFTRAADDAGAIAFVANGVEQAYALAVAGGFADDNLGSLTTALSRAYGRAWSPGTSENAHTASGNGRT